MITYGNADTVEEIKGIHDLQKLNLPRNLSESEKMSQGFVTIDHSLELLTKFNQFEKHVIAKKENAIIAYALTMTRDCKSDIPLLIPMFKLFEETAFDNKQIGDYNYIVVGQICVSKDYRGQGVFDNCYNLFRKQYQKKYEFAITEVAKNNIRSLKAHERVGFREVKRYSEDTGVEWVVVLWDWR